MGERDPTPMLLRSTVSGFVLVENVNVMTLIAVAGQSRVKWTL